MVYRSFLKENSFQASFSNWPLLQAALSFGVIEAVDAALANYLLSKGNARHEGVALFICYLSGAVRMGHLCAKFLDGVLKPEIEDVWPHSELSSALKELILKGIQELSDDLLGDGSLIPTAYRPLVHWNGCYYFQRYWRAESRLIEAWRHHERGQPTLQFDEKLFQRHLDENERLLPEQREACLQSCRQTLTLITGGPGTGKTYTAGILLQCLWKCLSDEQRGRCRIALSAPTGKAASQLQQSISRATGMSLTAMTLHTLLGLSPNGERSLQSPLLPYDLLLIDETSMVDVLLMEMLLRSIKPGARLVFLGDHWQLPPVDAGAPFAAFINYRNQGHSNASTLTQCLRAESREIITLAEAIRTGDVSQALLLLNNSSVIRWRPLPEISESETALQELCHFCLDFQHKRLLSPIRKGAWGVDTLNTEIEKRASSQREKPILIHSNHHHLRLYNGEVGTLCSDCALFPQGSGKPLRKIPLSLLPSYDYSYCLSIHKSQGSEFDHILILLPPGVEIMGREVLYTAVTRARRSVEIWADRETLAKTISRSTQRLSNIAARLQESD